ncbi:hypothetical protein C0J52_05938 [Blattella germanica]|nr:hypothetical protein C0J52_05938 [Blattella germanica]
MDPKGKIALVTGAAQGIGLTITKELLHHGAKGVSICDVNTTKGQEAAEQLQNEFGKDKVVFIKTDVSIEDEFKSAFEQTIKQFGGLDIVCNNAGIFNDRLWQRTISINVALSLDWDKALENVGKAVIHMIREGQPGSIWISESNEPVYEIKIPTHQQLRA